MTQDVNALKEYECRLLGVPNSHWRSVGLQRNKFAAATEFLCQLAGWGGANFTLEDIACREQKIRAR